MGMGMGTGMGHGHGAWAWAWSMGMGHGHGAWAWVRECSCPCSCSCSCLQNHWVFYICGMPEKFIAKLENFQDSNLWSYYIAVPDKISKKLIEGKDRRVVCDINSKVKIQVALMPSSKGFYFINLNKTVRTKLKIDKGDEMTVTLTKDRSEYGIGVPEFFKELCYQDLEGSDVFHKLTIGKQRTLLHYMGTVKSEQKQLERAMIILDYLKSVNGNLVFKELMEAFKNSRFK
jgi:hypothetical protein